jgi:tol-pal system protein YbgF
MLGHGNQRRSEFMTCIVSRLTVMPAIAAVMICATCAASAQQARPFAFLNRTFGNSERFSPAARQEPGVPTTPIQQPASVQDGRLAQAPANDLVMRIERLEAQIRQMTGVIEQLQYRNRQLEAQVKRLLGGTMSDLAPHSETPHPAGQAAATPVPGQPPVSVASGEHRGDAFDPTQYPGAPGAPRVLGTVPPSGAVTTIPNSDPANPVGAPGGRDAGAPLDLSTMAGTAAAGQPSPQTSSGTASPAQLPPPPPRTVSGTGAQVATLPPSNSPQDNYDLAYGYILRKDYALAEDGFRGFLRRFPGDQLAPDATYWLGESMFQRQRFREAAEAFLTVSTKYGTTAKAPNALLRLGQSLAALGEKEAACASLGEVLRKYPRASLGIRQGVEREQKRVHC